MRLALSNVSDVISRYLDEELLPKGTPFQKLATTFVGVGLARQAQNFLLSHKDSFALIGVLDDEGINIEEGETGR